MEQFDSYNPVNVRAILQKVTLLGFQSTIQQFALVDRVVQVATSILTDYIQSSCSSLILFLCESKFASTSSKSRTFEFCHSFLISLELHNSKEAATLLYLFHLDQCRTLAEFFLQSKNLIKSHTNSGAGLQLESVYLRFNDIISLARELFPSIGTEDLIKEVNQEIQQINHKR